jgi:2',3'-cyclic-nucleotide 2'-phosphodiesterase (5'-nucleotidase family)
MTCMMTTALSRRLIMTGIAASAAAMTLPRAVSAQHQGAQVLAISLADLHSPYARLPQILSEIDRIKADSGLPVMITINGDVFERGNVVALRSGGAADLAFLDALARRGPVVLNLGNHETALVDDMATTVARAEAMGVDVIGNLIDARRGRFFAPYAARVNVGGMRVGALGLAPTNPFVYRAAVRDSLQFLDPVAFAGETFGPVASESDVALLLSHAGVMPDRSILPGLPPNAVMIGGHDHLNFVHDGGPVPYVHGGSWGGMLTVIGLAPQRRASIETRAISADMPGDAALAALIADQMAEHLTSEETAVIGTSAVARDLPGSILFATEAVRAAADADIAMLGHTTFGQPIPQGPVTRFDFDAYIRFDGDIRVAEVPGAVLSQIMGRANQHLASSLDQRTGDFVHAAALDIDADATYRLAVNGWTAMNQGPYLGTEDLVFEPVEGLMLKAIVSEALAAG